MKLNEARKCSVGHGQNTAPLMFSWQIWRERETILDLEVSNSNTERNNVWLKKTVLPQDVSDKSHQMLYTNLRWEVRKYK